MPASASKVTKPKKGNGSKAKGKKHSNASSTSSSSPPPAIAQDDPTGPVYFWREIHSTKGWLSQWYPCAFRDAQGREYPTAEHYMMYHKALLFGDAATAALILPASESGETAPHPRDVKKLGRQVTPFDEAVWVANRERIVSEASYFKFSSVVPAAEAAARCGDNMDAQLVSERGGLRKMLLDTGDREIVEASPLDRIWGVGFGEKNAGRMREKWGLNLLGKALMGARERLRREEEKEDREGGGGEGEEREEKAVEEVEGEDRE